MNCLTRFSIAIFGIIPNLVIASTLEFGPTIDAVFFNQGYINCHSGSHFIVHSSEMSATTKLQIFESQNGKDFFIFQSELRPIKSNQDLHAFPCPVSNSDSIFQARLVDETSAGNMVPIPYSSGAKPYVDSVTNDSGSIYAQGNNLSGALEVYYKGALRGVVFGSQSQTQIPSNIHQNLAGLYTLKNEHGQSNSFFLKPYAKATFGYATSPSLLHNNELRNNCKNFYNNVINNGSVSSADENICNLENAYSFWGIISENSSDDEAEVFVEIPVTSNYLTGISPAGVGTRVELVVAVDSEQLKAYPQYYDFAVSAGEANTSSNKPFIDPKPHYVPLYKAVYLGESRLTLDARTSVAAHVVLDVIKSGHGPEHTANEYKIALQSPLMAAAVSRYNYLLAQSLTVDYGGRKALHHIASPLYVNDSNLNSIIQSLASEVRSNTTAIK